ncbi:MAG: type III-B CRISPR module RAMP protein Cmr4 [Kiritimatiellae bacterium]|nr:type III-B CRISPR module RAMP protein Cmr4 [Kiritimatiellia bacterium]
MKKMMISFFTRTPLHVGCGSSVGAIDLPVLRERATDLPVIPGSTLKGVLADLFLAKNEENKWIRTETGIDLLGNDDTKKATRGKLMVGEARLAAFPVRSAKGGFVWATCPLILGRLGISCGDVGEMEGLGSEKVSFKNEAFILEEYKITRKTDVPAEVIEALTEKCDLSFWKTTLQDRLVILSDTMLSYFAKNACEIAHHNKIDDETGTVAQGALFSQENVPSEALFVGEIMARDETAIQQLREKIQKERNLLQIGANATTGLGWCQVTMGEIQ